jgi:hypothetical protein
MNRKTNNKDAVVRNRRGTASLCAGYSLIEAIIAIAVLTVGAFGLLSLCYSSLNLESTTAREAERKRVAGYAYTTFRARCSRDAQFLRDVAEEGAFPRDGGFGEYPGNERYRWRILVSPHNEIPGLHEIAVLVFDRSDSRVRADASGAEENAAFVLRTRLSERE